jgi:hypothetical protein
MRRGFLCWGGPFPLPAYSLPVDKSNGGAYHWWAIRPGHRALFFPLTMYEIIGLELPKYSDRNPLLIHIKGQDTGSRYVELCPQIFLDEVPALIQALQAILDNQQAIKQENNNGEKQDDGEKLGVVQFTKDYKWIGRMVKLRDGTICAITNVEEGEQDYIILDSSRGYFPDGRYYNSGLTSDIDIIEVLPKGS